MDKDKAARVDREQELARRTLAEYVIRWRLRCGLSMLNVEALSKVASGRIRITGNVFNKMRLCAESARQWHPQSGLLLALHDINTLILAWTERGEWPAALDPTLQAKVQPFLRADGQPLSKLDWFRALIGEPGVLAPAFEGTTYETRLAHLAPLLGEVIERAMFAAGLSPIRDLDLLLSHYPLVDQRQQLRAVVLGDALYSPAELHQVLPGVAIALSETTGQDWGTERLLSCGNGNGTPSGRP